LARFCQHELTITWPGERGCVVLFDEATRPRSGVLTFLFTDIEGSTRRWEADAKAMRTALEAHNEVLRKAVAGHGGTLFNYTGDGMCAVFTSPRSAVDAAVAAQGALELPVRMGIATGEAELRGGEYFGAVLNRTARVMAAGHGGQILLDGATAGLLSGIDLVDLGTRRLRDIARPVEMFQVRADGLRTEFPPLKTLDSIPGNLKPQTTSFVGRGLAVAELETAVRANRLVTLTGVGGVGKTRLALEVAARLKSAFPDGVWVIELAPVGDPAAVPEATAAALGITPQSGLSLSDTIAAVVEDMSRLLVFDNCEHVLDAAADLIDAICARSATVQILATSREGLRLNNEQLWPVPSLEIRTGSDSAAALFIDRARAVSPAVAAALDDAADIVVEICRRLDGIPLAIELAASRMLSMTAIEVRDRLDDRFRLLVGSRRGLERHQTLRHAVQWSYDLLDDTEKTLLARCSVFAGGFDLASAHAVANIGDELTTLDLLDALVRKSLLVVDGSSGHTRYSMLETIRQFAEEQLVTSAAADEVRAAHARYFAGREADIRTLWDGPGQAEAYQWFGLELANLRSAFRWSADHDDLDSAIAIAIYVASLGYWIEQHEPLSWAEEIIEKARAVEHRRLAQLYAVATHCYVTGRVDDFFRYCAGAQSAIDSGRFDEIPEDLEASMASGYMTTGQPERSIELCRNVIARRPGAHVFMRLNLALALTFTGAQEEAMAAVDEMLSVVDAGGNPGVAGWAALAYGWAYRDLDPAGAYAALARGLPAARETGNRQMEASYAVILARLADSLGNPEDALDNLTLAIRTYSDSGSFSLMRSPLAVLTVLFDRLGAFESAAVISEFASTPLTRRSVPEFNAAAAHLRHVLGDEAYESLAGKGTSMTNASMAKYAYEQIDRVRADLMHVGESG
jgi:predicted ATPase/class 3 adenylate cyclase